MLKKVPVYRNFSLRVKLIKVHMKDFSQFLGKILAIIICFMGIHPKPLIWIHFKPKLMARSLELITFINTGPSRNEMSNLVLTRSEMYIGIYDRSKKYLVWILRIIPYLVDQAFDVERVEVRLWETDNRLAFWKPFSLIICTKETIILFLIT